MTTTLPLELDPASTALVLIDLQQGILPYAKAPYDGAAVIANAVPLAAAFHARKAPVVRVKVGFSADGGDMLKAIVDAPNPAGAPPSNWLDDPAELPTRPGDIAIVKRHWGAFHGTELDLQLRRRGIRTIVLAGIATAVGVESTARFAWELGYDIVFAEDATSGPDAAMHANSFGKVFPRLGRVRTAAEVLAALG
ncbi:MAG: hydrolase [Burkholderiaceae bacterium]|jgi:nicotinamidase-related amidase